MTRIFLSILLIVFSPITWAIAEGAPQQVDIAAAKSLFDEGVVFVDARKASSFEDGHIPGAHNLSISGGEFSEDNLLKLAGKNQKVVFYCDCPNQYCNISPLAANQAAKMGYQNIYFLKAAITGWSEAGYDVKKE
jgi:rhodanese-related sulfurtransferase